MAQKSTKGVVGPFAGEQGHSTSSVGKTNAIFMGIYELPNKTIY